MNNQTITLTKVYNPLNRAEQDTIQWQLQPNQTVADLLGSHGNIISKREGHGLAVSINGQLIPVEEYQTTTLLPGQCVTLVPILHGGGGGGKDIIRMVGMVILAIVATIASVYVQGLAVFASKLWASVLGSMVGGVIMIGGSMLLNAAIGQTTNSPALNGYQAANQSNSYSWNPQNTQQQGISIPWHYGTCKITGNIIGVYRETVGSQQYINALISLGNGIISPPTSIKINGQPYENYTGITINTRLGHLNQDVILGFDDTRIEYPQGTKVIYGTPVTYTTIGNDFDGLTITVGFPNGLYYYSNTGAITSVAVNFSIEVKKQGDTDWTHIARQAATTKISDGGYWSAGGWSEVWNEGYFTYDVYGEPIYNPGWYETVWGEGAVGSTDPNEHYEGECSSHNIFGINGWSPATWHWVGEPIRIIDVVVDFVTVTGAQTSSLSFDYASGNLDSGKYDIRITRLTADYTDTQHGDDFYLLAVSEILNNDFTYPGTALIGLRVLGTDQLSGSFSFECRTAGKLCRVYDGTDWTVVATSNPAWVCFDILTQPVFDNDLNVLEYAAYNPTDLDITRWLEWAEYCDNPVPDGKGGTEPRLTYNGSFDSKQSMWDAALNVAKIGRATPYWRGTTLTLSIDKPSDPATLISVGNIGLDSFEETFLSMENRAGSIEADFLNLEKDLDRDKFTVINPDAPAEWGSASLPLQGVIKPSEIWRHCRYYLATTQQLTCIVSVQMDIDAIAFTIGDVINVQHDVPMWGDGGRIVSATSTSVTIDRSVTIETGKTYSIMVRLLDGTVVERNITNAAGTYTVMNISTPFTSIPDAYDVYACGEVSQSIKPMRVVSIDPAGDLKRKITLTDYNESVYNTDLMLPVIPTQNYSGLKLSTVTGLLLAERMTKSPGGMITVWLDISWQRLAPNSIDKELEVMVNGISAGILPIDATGISVQVPDGATTTVYVRTVGWAGNKQNLTLAATASKFVIGKTAKPADVTGLVATTTTSGALRLDWNPNTEIDIDYYQVVVSTSSEWTQSMDAIRAYASSITIPAAKDGTYLVKAVDTSGNMSENAASVDVVMPTNSLYHLQQSLVEETAFTGTKTGCLVSGGTLNLDIASLWDGVSSVGYYESATVIDLGSIQTARCLCSLDFTCVDNQTGLDSILSLDAITSLDLIGVVGTAEGCEVEPQIALSQDGTTFGAWQRFSIGDYVGRKFKFRLKMTSYVQTVYTKISALHFDLYLQYRNQIMPNVSLNASPATSVAFTPVFIGVPMVRATVQNATSGDTVKITNITASQFDIQVLNGGIGVARIVDIEAIAY